MTAKKNNKIKLTLLEVAPLPAELAQDFVANYQDCYLIGFEDGARLWLYFFRGRIVYAPFDNDSEENADKIFARFGDTENAQEENATRAFWRAKMEAKDNGGALPVSFVFTIKPEEMNEDFLQLTAKQWQKFKDAMDKENAKNEKLFATSANDEQTMRVCRSLLVPTPFKHSLCKNGKGVQLEELPPDAWEECDYLLAETTNVYFTDKQEREKIFDILANITNKPFSRNFNYRFRTYDENGELLEKCGIYFLPKH